MKTKICSHCKRELSIENFTKDSTTKDSFEYSCKNCKKEYRLKNREKIRKKYKENYKLKYYKNTQEYYLKHKTEILLKNRTYIENNKEHVKERKKKHYILNKNKILNEKKEYYEKNKNRINIYKKNYTFNKRNNNSDFKILCLLRRRILLAIKNNLKSDNTKKLIGCSISYLKEHLQQTAISNNYKNFNIKRYSGKEYHIDHIVPCSAFNLSCSYHQHLCFNWSNLQILDRVKNLKKGDKFLC